MKYLPILTAIASALAAVPVALAQSASDYVPPQTSWGTPDLQGNWSSKSLTTMSRPAGASGLILSEEEAAELFNKNIYTRVAKDEAGRSEHTLLTDANPDRAYNFYWMDPGDQIAKINGEYRSSWIVEPANGQIPFIDNLTTGRGRRPSDPSTDEEFADFLSDNPEDRSLAERCVWFGSTSGPVIRNGLYNSNLQIVQTPEHVMLMGEMIHEVRVVSLTGERNPSAVPVWGGDSIGWYDGDTLTVETTNVVPRSNSLISSNGKVTERFTRVSDDRILYEFTVDDPTMYTSPWKGEMPLNSSPGLYEYACHEGNYGLANILTGARAFERAGRSDENGVRKQIFAGVPAGDE